jgi:hypothetical protein
MYGEAAESVVDWELPIFHLLLARARIGPLDPIWESILETIPEPTVGEGPRASARTSYMFER